MRVLLTNDDGVHSPGLWSAAEALQDIADVVVVAPDRDQSGVGTARTLLSVVRANEIPAPVEGVKTFSVEGTPTDCVILATEALGAEPFDLVVSGINHGANLGLDVMCSGTFGAAFEGWFRGIPSVAVSVGSLTNVDFEAAAQATRALALAISKSSFGTSLLLNVNLPNVAAEQLAGVQITTLGPKAYLESVERGNDGRRTHYWIKHNKPLTVDVAEGTDIWAVRNNRVSITPINLSFTPYEGPNSYRVLADEVAAGLELRPTS